MRVSQTNITPLVGKGATKSDAFNAVGVELEQWKSDNPNKDLVGVWGKEDVEDVDGITLQVYILHVIASKNDLPDWLTNEVGTHPKKKPRPNQ